MLDAKLLPIPQFGFPLARMGSLPVGVGEDERCFSVLEPTQSLLLKGEGHSGRFDFRGTTSVLTLDGWPERQGSQTTETCANPPEYQSPRRGVHVVSISIQFRADFRDSARPERREAQDQVGSMFMRLLC